MFYIQLVRLDTHTKHAHCGAAPNNTHMLCIHSHIQVVAVGKHNREPTTARQPHAIMPSTLLTHEYTALQLVVKQPN